MTDPLTWQQADSFLQAMGSETHLARRLAGLRQRAGLSQEGLSKAMAAAGCPLHQSSISKIENPAPGGRRSISIQEAVAFSRVFGISLVELLLPEDALKHVAIARDLADGPESLIARDEAVSRYEGIASRLADLYWRDPGWRTSLRDELHRAVEASMEQDDNQLLKARMQFLDDVVIERQRGREPV